jgi:hypothetical protein
VSRNPKTCECIRCEVTERLRGGALYVETVAIDIWYVAAEGFWSTTRYIDYKFR